MPQPNKKRGRRMKGQKRKHDEAEDDAELEAHTKRRKSDDIADSQAAYMPLEVQEDESLDAAYPAAEKAFFGMLDEEEQEYFKRADDILETNAFPDAEERNLFLSSVYREAEGKELKLAQSQSCSRLMERLIRLSTPQQLKRLFQKLSGNFIHLVTHRFASHCCEALFSRAAPLVTEELLAPATEDGKGEINTDPDEVYVSFENLFLFTLAELNPSVGYLLTQPYASHVLRVLLLVLSGEAIENASTKNLLQSKKKESNSVHGAELPDKHTLAKARSTPKAFSEALQNLITESIAGLDTDQLRLLATHKNGNPTLQLLLKLELTHFGKERAKNETSVIRTLLPDDPITADSGSASFINGLVYDAVGSHLVEQIVEHAPGKMFKALYGEFFRERLASHARNEIAAYVVCRILERLGQDDLLDAHERLVPTISNLLQKNRTVVIRTLIERCAVRKINTQAIAVHIDNTWHGPDGFEVKKLLKVDQTPDEDTTVSREKAESSEANTAPSLLFARNSEPVKVHFNILAQAMLLVPGSLSALVLDALGGLDNPTLLGISKDHVVSRTLQVALTTRSATMITTRKLIQHFYGSIGDMALDSSASHVVDAIWEGTCGLAHIRERIAEELAENEAQLRDSPCGRAVWRNWKMDLYKRRMGDWIKQSKAKASNDGFQSFSELDADKAANDSKGKTALQLSRERHMKKKKETQSSEAGGKRKRGPTPATKSKKAKRSATAPTATAAK